MAESETLDPVLRCDQCQELLRLETIHAHGKCPKCGNKRMRNVTVFSPAERDQIDAWGLHDFLELFESVNE